MAQIVTKFIGADQVTGPKILLANDVALRARNQADNADVDLIKLNTSDEVVITGLTAPVNPSDAATKAYVDGVSGGANTTLSNLTSPVAVNQDILPDGSNSRNLGATSAFWAGIVSAGVAAQTISFRVNAGVASGAGEVASSDSVTLPDGATQNVMRVRSIQVGRPLVLMTDDFTGGNGADVKIETQNRVSTDNSGSILLYTGSVVSGTRGQVVINASQLDMSSTKIVNLADPTNPQDAATKAYVDGLPSGSNYRKEQITLTPTDITNQFVTLANVPNADSVMLFAGGLCQNESTDWEIDGSNANQINFLGQLATGGAAELVSGDVIVISYAYA